jgi:hypothetical protein
VRTGAGTPGGARLLFLFLDGLGIGPDDPATNPLASAELPALEALLDGRRPVAAADGAYLLPLAPLDAVLGVEGLPQSATGQAALLTGVNAPALLGGHRGPYPDARLRQLLAEASIWRRLLAAGRGVAFANAFPEAYLERARRGGRMGAIARAAQLAGVPLRGPAELRAGRAVSAFLTNAGWREQLGYTDLEAIDEAEAGARLAALAAEHDFTLFEYYATDIAGHAADPEAARRVLESFDRFLAAVSAHWHPPDVLVLASDHGNIEDLTTRRHTRNPALGVWRGPAPAEPLSALTDVAPAVLARLTAARP